MKKKEFFEKMNELYVALTFDDVRLRTGYSSVMPDQVSVESKFSRNVHLKIPIVSAAMDTVTEYKLAIEISKLGGLGVIHRSLSKEEQAAQVSKVKHHLNALIENPICVSESDSISKIIEEKEMRGYGFSTFPVLNSDGKLVGILSENDFDLCDNLNLFAREVMSAQVITSGKNSSVDEAYAIMIKSKKKVLPLVDENYRIAGMYIFTDVKRIKSGSSQQYNLDVKGRLIVGAAIGAGDEAMKRVEKLVAVGVDVVVIDTAHGDSKPVFDTLQAIKSLYPDLDVVVGNVSEPDSVRRLIEAGADGVKIGQGPGSICTTRIIAGVGSPQVSAVYKCSLIADQHGIPICADGGIRYSGDVTIALGAGAHCVMLGSMLAGTKESPGEIIFWEGRQWKNYRGMGSLGAMQENKASRERYGQDGEGKSNLVPEGVEGLVPFKGYLKDVIFQYVGGLKRGMGYVGAVNITELRDKADFVRLSSSSQVESHPHTVNITKESPNYSKETR